MTKTPIVTPADWLRLEPCSVNKGSLAREVRGLDLLLDKVKGEDVPVIFTVFSPLTIADKLSGNTLRQHLSEGRSEEIQFALRVITQTTCDLVRAVLDRGADGIFSMISWASRSTGSLGNPTNARCFRQQRRAG